MDEAFEAIGHSSVTRLVESDRLHRFRAALILASARDEMRQGHYDMALQAAEKATQQAPSWLPAVIALAQSQMTAGHHRAAQRTIEKNWAHMAHPQLAAIYRASESGSIDAYKKIERLCRNSEDTPVSRLTLAETALEASIWGEARRHLTALVNGKSATQSAYRLMARLERREKGDEQSALQWMTKAVDAPPDPVWLCRVCGGSHDEWQAACRHCGSFATLEWQSRELAEPKNRASGFRSRDLEKLPFSEQPASAIAVFDYDHTLITGDSFWPFLILTAGNMNTSLALMEALILWFFHKCYGKFLYQGRVYKGHPFITHLRQSTFVAPVTGGKITGSVCPCGRPLRRWQQWNEAVRQKLLDHHAQGHHIVIASGALDLYLPELVKDLPHNAIICTQVDLATGAMTAGNCVRLRKAEMVNEYIAAHGPFAKAGGTEIIRTMCRC